MDRCRPVGFRFHPTDQELIEHFLFMKNNPNSNPNESLLPEFDMYGDAEPWTIWESYGGPLLDEEDLFFFTRLKKHCNRINRRIASGTWSQGEPSKAVYAKNNKETPIGRKTKLRYESKVVEEHDGCWFMDEYSGVGDGDYVICRLRVNPSKRPSPLSAQGAITKSNNKRKCQAAYPKHSKKTKSLTVSDQHDAITTNEAPKTVYLNQERQLDQGYESQHFMLEEANTAGHIDYTLVELQKDVLAPAVSEQQQTCSSSFVVPDATNDVFVSQNSLIICEAQVSISDDEFSFASDEFNDFDLPIDDAYINSEDFSKFIFGDEFLSGGDDIGSSSFSELLEDQHHQV